MTILARPNLNIMFEAHIQSSHHLEVPDEFLIIHDMTSEILYGKYILPSTLSKRKFEEV